EIGPIMLGQSSSLLETESESGDTDAAAAIIATGAKAPEESQYSYGLSSDGSWIAWHGRNVLWLPSEYRPSCSAVSEPTVAIGCPSGRVLVIHFSPVVSPIR